MNTNWMRTLWMLAAVAGMATSGCEEGPAPELDPADTTTEPRQDDDPDTVDVDPVDTPDKPTPEPCLEAVPAALDFGAVQLGAEKTLAVALTTCSHADVQIQNIAFEAGGASAFVLPSMPMVPATVPDGEALYVDVLYAPDAAVAGIDGVPVADEATVQIVTIDDVISVPVSGFGVAIESPVARIDATEGGVVPPQTVMHLSGAGSHVDGVEVASYQWSVVQPEGSASVFLPSDSVPEPTFEANVAGTYEFTLNVWDMNGVPSPVPASFTLSVVPDSALHVELLWDTPGDPDQTDEGPEAGADLDLHFAYLHPAQPDDEDPWFDEPFDCFWFNSNPNWGSFDPSVDDDPSLDRDDTDGAGPENLNLGWEAETGTYRIAAHYWSDHGYGTSYATIRVFLGTDLVYEQTGVELEQGDLWEVAQLSWPDGAVTPFESEDGGPLVIEDYQPPGFVNP